MPVVWRRNVNRVDVRVVHYSAKVLPDLSDAGCKLFAGGFRLPVVDIAKIAVFDSFDRRGLGRYALAATAAADECDAQA